MRINAQNPLKADREPIHKNNEYDAKGLVLCGLILYVLWTVHYYHTQFATSFRKGHQRNAGSDIFSLK